MPQDDECFARAGASFKRRDRWEARDDARLHGDGAGRKVVGPRLKMTSPASLQPIRRVQTADVPSVVALVRETLAEFGLTFGQGAETDAPLLSLPASYESSGGAFWVATTATGALVGTCGVAPVAPGVFEVRKMYLRPAARGSGVAQRLLDECVTWARAHGGRRLVLDTIDAMDRAIRFYERNGFVRDDAEIRGSRCTRGYSRNL